MERRSQTEVVGLNIRARRRERGLTHADVIDLLAAKGLTLSRSTINQLELGKRSISVDDLVTLGDAFGVPPHVLLYPQPDVDEVGRDDDEDHTIPAIDLANWLWFSDAFPLTDPRERSERSVWASSTGILDRLPAEEIERLALTYGPEQMTTTKTDEQRSER